MRLMTALALLLVAANSAAAIYKWTKPDGSVIYSDRPPTESASPADLPPVQEITIVPPASSDKEAQASPEATPNPSQGTQYTKLAIASPEDNAVLRDNGGEMKVAVNLEPALQQGDQVVIALDGKEIGGGSGTSMTLSNVDRGSHNLRAAVKDSSGKTLIQSSTISFTMKRTSVNQPAR